MLLIYSNEFITITLYVFTFIYCLLLYFFHIINKFSKYYLKKNDKQSKKRNLFYKLYNIGIYFYILIFLSFVILYLYIFKNYYKLFLVYFHLSNFLLNINFLIYLIFFYLFYFIIHFFHNLKLINKSLDFNFSLWFNIIFMPFIFYSNTFFFFFFFRSNIFVNFL